MALKFQNGDAVRQVVAPIAGTVTRFAFDQATGEITYFVTWTDENGDHERAFSADEIEAAA